MKIKLYRVAGAQKMLSVSIVLLLGVANGVTNAHASELVYTPVNPSFGGDPLNGVFLLSNALAQDTEKDPNEEEFEELTALGDFNDQLERALLSRLSSELVDRIIDENGKFVPGRTETKDFIIDIINTGDGFIKIRTQDKLTGEATEFVVSQAG